MSLQWSEERGQIAACLVAIQEGVGGLVAKDAKGQRSRFTSLPKLMEVVNPIATKNACAIVWDQEPDGVRCYLVHMTGEWVSNRAAVGLADGLDAQGVGSAYTYGRRYSLQALLGIASEDDDGQRATDHRRGGGQQRRQPPPLRQEDKPTTADVRAQVGCVLRSGAWTKQDVADVLANFGAERIDQLVHGQRVEMMRALLDDGTDASTAPNEGVA